MTKEKYFLDFKFAHQLDTMILSQHQNVLDFLQRIWLLGHKLTLTRVDSKVFFFNVKSQLLDDANLYHNPID